MVRWTLAFLAIAVAAQVNPAGGAVGTSGTLGLERLWWQQSGRKRNRRKTGMSGKGRWISVVSFATAVGWVLTNERRAIQSGGLWAAARRAATKPKTADAADAGAMVHVTGQATSPGPVVDGPMKVTTPGAALILRRIVEQYQWHEVSKGRKHKIQIHTYHEGWATHHIDSSKFADESGHENPAMRYRGRTFVHSEATVCGFHLKQDLLHQLQNYERLKLSASDFDGAAGFEVQRLAHGWVYMRPSAVAVASAVDAAEDSGDNSQGSLFKRSVYVSGKTLQRKAVEQASDAQPDEADAKSATKQSAPTQPKVGDIRVRWEMATPQTVSVMSMHAGDGEFKPWLGGQQSKPNAATEVVHVLHGGSMSCDAMVTAAQQRSGSESWEQRMFGFGTMTMGSFLYCHFMEYTTDFADVVEWIPMAGPVLASFNPNTQSMGNMLAIPLCSASLTLCLCLLCNSGWRAHAYFSRALFGS